MNKTFISIPIAAVVLFYINYSLPLYLYLPFIDTIFITIIIFLFATLVGFFISRQSTRYGQIIAKVTDFDGLMSFMYRSFSIFGEAAQSEFAEILHKHYKMIVESNDWDSYFAQKTSTLTDINELIIRYSTSNNLNDGQNAFVEQTFSSLRDMQRIRKNLIALYKEHIPKFQWLLVMFLSIMLILTVSSVYSYDMFFVSIIKSIFATSVVAVVIMLWKLNRLAFFENMVGLSSAEDVLAIVGGKR